MKPDANIKPSVNASSPRLILVDDNIRNTGGHYFELATLLLSGAQTIGYQPVLAPHQSFAEEDAVDPAWKLVPTFSTRRLVDWSLGVDGKSTIRRDITGKPVGGSGFQNAWNRVRDNLGRPARRPATMLKRWTNDLVNLLNQIQPTSSDVILINTGDDFAMLGLAAAMHQVQVPALRIDVTFHFALFESDQSDAASRLKQLGQQVNACVKLLQPHDVHLHATTKPLAKQMRQAELRQSVTAIPYPTRRCEIRQASSTVPKVVLAGLPRREKGRGEMRDLLAEIEHPLLRSNRFQFSMHLPASGWRTMVPASMHRDVENAAAGGKNHLLEVMMAHLSTDDYHHWLDTADVGLFLYQPDRYVARCSGVLLEMMARGIPVIVPDHCWLADQVRAAGGHRSIGFIFQDRKEIPALLQQFSVRKDEITERARKHAMLISKRHDATNTLRTMGLAEFFDARQVA